MSSQVINMRADAEVKERLRAAADASHVTLSQFVLDAARSKADEVLAAVQVTVLPADFYDDFFAALDQPAPDQLSALAAKPRVYERR